MYFYHLYLEIKNSKKCKPADKENTYQWGIWYQVYDPSELYTDLQYSIKQNLIVTCLKPWHQRNGKNPVTYKPKMLKIEYLFISKPSAFYDSHVSKPLNWKWPTQSHILSPMPQATFLTSTKSTIEKPRLKKERKKKSSSFDSILFKRAPVFINTLSHIPQSASL